MLWYSNKIARVCGPNCVDQLLRQKQFISGRHGAGVYVKQVIEELCGLPENTILVHALTDYKGAYQAIHSTVAVEDRQLRAEVVRVKDFIIRGEVNTINWIPVKKMLADDLTKRTASRYNLLRVFQKEDRVHNE